MYHPPRVKHESVAAVFGPTIFLSAFLLFQVQLIIAKYILPWFGGTPAVFTTCILFFQTVLLLGYCYAHFLDGKLKVQVQTAFHILVVLFAIGWLVLQWHRWGSPLLPDNRWKQTAAEHPFTRVVVLLLASTGVPYFVLSTTGPLLQSWYSRVRSDVPYRLYALSNAGSLLGLITYPFLVEPTLRLHTQAVMWGFGFVAFGATCILTAIISSRAPELRPAEEAALDQPSKPASGRRLLWLLLAATASLSLLATTSQICQEVAAVPLLWVLPLSVYLLSFIICFSSDQSYSRNLWCAALGLATLLVCFAMYHPELRIIYLVGIYSFALLAVCMVCHGELYRLKPHKRYLTHFYLFVAAGGVLGGILASILSPLLFKGFWEYPLSLCLALVLLCVVLLQDQSSWIYIPKPIVLTFAMFVVFAGPVLARLSLKPLATTASSVAVAGLAVFFFSGRPPESTLQNKKGSAALRVWIGMVLVLAIIASPFISAAFGANRIYRNFYGVLTVSGDEVNGTRLLKLLHGRVLHGAQLLNESGRRRPTEYYSMDSGIGMLITNYPGRIEGRNLRIGVVGLGVGTIAAYGKAGDFIRFYEINPEVIRLAVTGPKRVFSFVPDSSAHIDIVPGDARLSLEQELNHGARQNFDILAIDAFSGDAIPVHLLTSEAFHLYVQHLNADGILAFHVSNNALDLSPVVARLAADAGMSAWLAQSHPSDPASAPSKWIIVPRQGTDLPIALQATQKLVANPRFPLWTDDYSDLIRVLAW